MKKIFLTIVFGLSVSAAMAVSPSRQGAVSVRTVKSGKVMPPAASPKILNRATSQQVAEIVRVLNKEISDSRRVDVAKLCVMLCPIATADLAKMARTFSFDSNRLDFYKYAYGYCPDREKFLLLKDSFRSSSYSREFVNYLAKMQQ